MNRWQDVFELLPEDNTKEDLQELKESSEVGQSFR